MRNARLVQGFNNKQKVRFICDGFAMYSTVQGLCNIASTKHRAAIMQTLSKLSSDRLIAQSTNQPIPTGLAWTLAVRNEKSELENIQVQIDLCDDSIYIL